MLPVWSVVYPVTSVTQEGTVWFSIHLYVNMFSYFPKNFSTFHDGKCKLSGIWLYKCCSLRIADILERITLVSLAIST